MPKKSPKIALLLSLGIIVVTLGLFLVAKTVLKNSNLRPEVDANKITLGEDKMQVTTIPTTEAKAIDGETPSSDSLPVETSSVSEEKNTAETTIDTVAFFGQLGFYDNEGIRHTFAEFRGKTILVNNWASWCGPCRQEMPDIQKFYEAHKDEEDVIFLSINSTDGQRETQETAEKYIADNGFTFPVYFDKDMELANKLGLSALPTSFTILKDGSAGMILEGAYSLEDFEKLLMESKNLP